MHVVVLIVERGLGGGFLWHHGKRFGLCVSKYRTVKSTAPLNISTKFKFASQPHDVKVVWVALVLPLSVINIIFPFVYSCFV